MNITVYSTPFCAPCERLKQYLDAHGVVYVRKDLMMDEDAADLMEQKGIRSAPVLEIDGQFYAGAQIAPESLARLLGLDAT